MPANNTSPPSNASGQRADGREIDLGGLSLTQLHRLAGQGSRRARAELERRMLAPPARPGPPPPPAAPAPAPRPAPPQRRAPPEPSQPIQPPPRPSPPSERQNLIDQIELVARQDEQRARASGPPHLAGLMLLIWAVLILFGTLVLLAFGGGRGGLYYLFCALGMGVTGALLMRCNRWALALHSVLLAAGLAWSWVSADGSVFGALTQALPLLIPATWMAFPQVREGLE